MTSTRHARDPAGFTLIEVLICVVIIALLLGLLLAGLSKAREQAQVAACLSNQRQLGQGAAGYVASSRQMPGMSMAENISGYHGPWGTRPCWGAENVQWNVYYGGLPDPATGKVESGPVGIGYVYPFVYSVGSYDDGKGGATLDGRVFLCPGNTISFGQYAGGRSWYEENWRPSSDAKGFGQPGRYASGTYVWRGGAYPFRDLPPDDPGWNGNWNDAPLRGDSPLLHGRSMLTCYYPAHDFTDGVATFTTAWAPHGARSSNLLLTDGSARTWRLPAGVVPFSTEHDSRTLRQEQFYTQSGVIASSVGDNRFVDHCAPWWWIVADHVEE